VQRADHRLAFTKDIPMKNQPRNGQKLALRKETLRQLDNLDLSDVAGGLPTTFTQVSCVDCRSVRVKCNTTPL
jgi:hypothetical protein